MIKKETTIQETKDSTQNESEIQETKENSSETIIETLSKNRTVDSFIKDYKEPVARKKKPETKEIDQILKVSRWENFDFSKIHPLASPERPRKSIRFIDPNPKRIKTTNENSFFLSRSQSKPFLDSKGFNFCQKNVSVKSSTTEHDTTNDHSAFSILSNANVSGTYGFPRFKRKGRVSLSKIRFRTKRSGTGVFPLKDSRGDGESRIYDYPMKPDESG